MTQYGPFTAWDILLKSQPEAEDLASLATLMADRSSGELSFTAIEPDGSLKKYYLGSLEGNVKFLLGYVNPGFHLSPFHFRVMDPSINDKQAQVLYDLRGHPAQPSLWVAAGQVPTAEGDLKGGTPHPFFGTASKRSVALSKDTLVTVGGVTHLVSPSDKSITNVKLEVTYPWDAVTGSPQYYLYPELADKIDSVPEDTDEPSLFEDLVAKSADYAGQHYSDSCFELVKSLFPAPGAVVQVADDVFALFTTGDIQYLTKGGEPTTYSEFELPSLSLLDTDDNISADLVMRFGEDVLGINVDNITELMSE